VDAPKQIVVVEFVHATLYAAAGKRLDWNPSRNLVLNFGLEVDSTVAVAVVAPVVVVVVVVVAAAAANHLVAVAALVGVVVAATAKSSMMSAVEPVHHHPAAVLDIPEVAVVVAAFGVRAALAVPT
jgi:hypothetical protein